MMLCMKGLFNRYQKIKIIPSSVFTVHSINDEDDINKVVQLNIQSIAHIVDLLSASKWQQPKHSAHLQPVSD